MKYNSIGEQLIVKAQELDPNYKPDKFNDMSEAIDVILNNSGGDIWLDIAPYLSEDDNSISQEGYDLVYNAFFPATENPSNKYAGILYGYKMFFNGLVTLSDKTGFNFIFNMDDGEEKGSLRITIYDDKSFEFGSEIASSSNQVWFDLDTTSGTITQDQYNEIKSLIDSNSLAGIKHTTLGIYFPLVNSENNGTFTFGHYGLGSEFTGSNTKYSMDKMEMIIKSDLSVSFSLKDVYIPVLTQNLSSQSIPSIKTDGYQENLTIGKGLTIENGVLKTNNIPELPSDANTKTYVLKSVNGVLTWSE